MIQMGLWGGGNGSLEGAEALNVFWSTPGLDGASVPSSFPCWFSSSKLQHAGSWAASCSNRRKLSERVR